MFTLGSKSLVINDASLVTVAGNLLSVPGFGTIDKTDPGYSKVTTVGVSAALSSIDLGTAGLVSGSEIAIYWQNLRYIGEGLSNMSSTPQAPLIIPFPSTVATIAEAWELYQEGFGESELFDLTPPDVLKSKNTAVNIIQSAVRTLIAPTVDVMTPQTGFRYNRFGGTVGIAGVTSGDEGVGNGFQVEESVRTASFDATDPYSTKEHGSQEVELDALYNIYDFTVNTFGGTVVTVAGLVATASINNAGSYTGDGTYTATQASTSGVGSGAIFTVTITAGIIASIDSIDSSGSGYAPADTITLAIVGPAETTAGILDVDSISSITENAWNVHENLAQNTPDENVINNPIKLRIYAKQGDASVPVDAF